MERGEQEMEREREKEAENTGLESDESETGSAMDTRNFGFNTPPDSPNAIAQFIRDQSLQYEGNGSLCFTLFTLINFSNCFRRYHS